MNSLAILLAVVAGLAIVVIAWLLYMGFFQYHLLALLIHRKIHVEVLEVPEMTVLYAPTRLPHHSGT